MSQGFIRYLSQTISVVSYDTTFYKAIRSNLMHGVAWHEVTEAQSQLVQGWSLKKHFTTPLQICPSP